MGSQPWFLTLATLTGWTLAAAGILLLLWALVWDRSRGCKRCPKCWYDMSGAHAPGPAPGEVANEQWTCPECGRDILGAVRLHRTRRRWRWAAASVVLLATGWMAACTPAIIATGWWAAAPRPVLIAMIPWIERDGPHNWQQPPSRLDSHINSRLFAGRGKPVPLWWPEQWMASWVCAKTLNGERGGYTKLLAARLLVLTRDDSLAPVHSAGRGFVVLAKSALVYERASSYSDLGLVTSSSDPHYETPFITAFVRSERRFRFELLSDDPIERRLSVRYALWANGDDTRSWWTLKPHVKKCSKLSMGLAGPASVSWGAAMEIPSLLVPDQLSNSSRFLFAADAVYVGEESVGSSACHRISFSVRPEVVWVDKYSFLIRRIDEKGRFPETITYEPKVNIELGPEWFQFDPEHPELSPLQDERGVK